MNYNHLLYFSVLAETEHYTTAAARLGITFIPNECVESRPGIAYVPLRNWHQGLYMCILYDKWLEPSVWNFVELTVQRFRAKKRSGSIMFTDSRISCLSSLVLHLA